MINIAYIGDKYYIQNTIYEIYYIVYKNDEIIRIYKEHQNKHTIKIKKYIKI